ncbi:MAG: hypothetical protein K2J36_04060 [Ruminococcus sp.]|nr:hypothetical protein [Ruminococcus sp.]MDE6797169.1 hypothetical protein [Ruminococcus sp.]
MEDYEGSKVLTALKALFGAVIGALPGVAIWIIFGKLGFITLVSGMAIAMGVVFLCSFFVGDSDLSPLVLLIICGVVFITAILISEKIVWTMEMSDLLSEYLPTFREKMIDAIIAENPDISRTDADGMITDDLYNQLFTETFGIKEATFGECFSNFGTLLENLEMKGKYISSLVKSIVFGGFGGFVFFAKIM